MPHITDNLILEQCSAAVGPSAQLPLQGSLPGYRTFASKCADGDTLHYLIRAVDVVGRPTGQWEIGRGIYRFTGGNHFLERAVVVDSSTGSAVDFAAGAKYVTLAQIAPVTDQVRNDLQASMGLDLVGCIMFVAANAPPAGSLKANGAAVSRTTYARLFARIGTTFGAGDGATTFNLPDARGEFLRGWDDGRGVDSGRSFGSLQASANLSHNHAVTDPGHTHGVADPGHAHLSWTDSQGYHVHGIGNKGSFGGSAGYVDSGSASSSGYASTDGAGAHTHNVGVGTAATSVSLYSGTTSLSVNSNGGSEARPRNVAMLAVIRY